jgi:hypothetical protein
MLTEQEAQDAMYRMADEMADLREEIRIRDEKVGMLIEARRKLWYEYPSLQLGVSANYKLKHAKAKP